MASNGWSGRRGSWPSDPREKAGTRRLADTSKRPIGSGRRSRRLPHVAGEAIETYGGQPNQQAADMVTTFDPGRMIWNGYTGAAGWMFRQALEGVLGLRLQAGAMVPSTFPAPAGELSLVDVVRDLTREPLARPGGITHRPRSGSPANNSLIRLDIHGQHPREDEADGNHLEPCATSLERRAARRQRPGPRVRLFRQASRLDQSRRGG